MDEEEYDEWLRQWTSAGGRARAKKLSKEERQAIGRKGGLASGKARRKKAQQKKKPKKSRKAKKQ